VEDRDKPARLKALLRSLPFPPSLVLVFVGMKRTADVLERDLRQAQFNATALHGDLKQWEREMGLKSFKDGSGKGAASR
jgi:ATP-dependent RNA helicase DeaD